MSMARLWRTQGEVQQARELLAPVYGLFTQGFDTRDLKEAKALRADGCAHREALLDGNASFSVPDSAPHPRFRSTCRQRGARETARSSGRNLAPVSLRLARNHLQPAGFLRDSISQEKSITGEPRSEIASCFVPKTEPCRRQGLFGSECFGDTRTLKRYFRRGVFRCQKLMQ